MEKTILTEADFADHYDASTNSIKPLPRRADLGYNFLSGVVGKEEQKGVTLANAAETIGQNIGPVAGGTLGAVAGPIGAGAGAAAGRAVQDAAQNAAAALGVDTKSKTPKEVVTGVAVEGAMNALGAKFLPPIAKAGMEWTASAIKGAGKLLATGIGKTITGIPAEAMTRLIDYPSEVFNKISMNPETGSTLAKAFKESIARNMELAEEAYRKNINSVINFNTKYGPGWRLNMQDELGDVIAETRKQFGYGLPNRIGDEAETTLFNKFANLANGMKDATIDEAYYLQRDLTHAIRNNGGKTISAALGKIKGVLMDKLNTAVPEIGEANTIYRQAHVLDDEVSKVLNADNAAEVIRRAFKNKGDLRDALLNAADQVSGVRQQLEGVMNAAAGKSFQPWMRDLPQTGFTAGLGALGFGAATGNAAAQGTSMALAPALSPRIMGGMVYGASKISQAISKPLAESLNRLGRPAIPFTMAIVKDNLGTRYNTIKAYNAGIDAAMERGEIEHAAKLKAKMDAMVKGALDKRSAKK